MTYLNYRQKSTSVGAGGFAIYKGDPTEDAVALMFNVYEGADNVMTILEILRKYSAKATFFIGGIWAEKNPETLREILLSGQEIGSHGYLHKDHAKLSLEQNKEEIAISSNLIYTITGKRVTLFAPPSGSFGEATEIACKALGMKMIMWTKDTIDWRDTDTDLLIKRATKEMSKGDLILMHPKAQTVRALPSIIQAYQEAGYELKTVSEVLG